MATSDDTEFNWKGESGAALSRSNPSTPDAVDAHWVRSCGRPASQILEQAIKEAKKAGLDPANATVLDIGCSTGGLLSVLESALGFPGDRLHGVDLSPAAVAVASEQHPQFHVKVVDGFEYAHPDPERGLDLVYHSAVLCQIPPERYELFFGKIRELQPRFYMFLEAINPNGYEKIANSAMHHHSAGEHHGHGHHHDQGHHHDHGHHNAEGMKEGYHHTNDATKLVEQYLPEATKLYSFQLEPTHSLENTFKALHYVHMLVSIYQLRK